MIQIANIMDIHQNDDEWVSLGPDPTSENFGGNTFTSDSMTWNSKDDHSTYWDEGNAARKNMGLIFTGQGEHTA